MIILTIINDFGQAHGILDLKKGFDEALNNIPAVSEDLLRIPWKCMKYALTIRDYRRLQEITGNYRLQEIFILNFFQFYWKINRNQLQIVAETTYGLNPY